MSDKEEQKGKTKTVCVCVWKRHHVSEEKRWSSKSDRRFLVLCSDHYKLMN